VEVKLHVSRGYGSDLLAELRKRDGLSRIVLVGSSETGRLLDSGGWEVLSIVCSNLGFLLAVRAWLRERKERDKNLVVRVVVEGSVSIDLNEMALDGLLSEDISEERCEGQDEPDDAGIRGA